MMGDDALRIYGMDFGVASDSIRLVAPDPSKAYHCTHTIAEHRGHELRRNTLTNDLYDRCDRELRYVGRSYGDDDWDICTWIGYLLDMGLVREGS
jgi:hypothetical protein